MRQRKAHRGSKGSHGRRSDGGHGRSGVNAGDIIPPFDIAGVHYDGNNVNLLRNTSGCPLPPPGNSGSGGTNFQLRFVTREWPARHRSP